MEKSLVKNAADKKQVKDARRKEKSERDRELLDIKNVLETESGRRLLWRMLARCKTFGTVWSGSALIHYNAGQQDIGHWLLSEMNQSDPDSFLLMMKENYKQGENNV